MPAIMCDSTFVFGEFILLSVQPVALATPVVKTHCSRSRVSVLRIGFAVYALYCASFPSTPSMRDQLDTKQLRPGMAAASKLGDQECRCGQSTTRSARPATKDRRRASSRDAGVAMQCGIRTATTIYGGTAVEKNRSTGNVMNACRKR